MENEKLEPIGELKMPEPKRFEECEWCFQFDDDEPQIFAWVDDETNDETPEIKFTLSNIDGAYISFTDKNSSKKFKLFPRELSDKGKELRDFQKKSYEEMINKKDESKN